MVPLGAVLIVLIIFSSLTTVVIGLLYLSTKNKEKMAIIQKGTDPSLFKDEFKSSGKIPVKIGIVLIGIAIGIIVGSLFANYTYIFPSEEVPYFSAIFLFGGLGLLLSTYIDKKKKNISE